MKKTTIALFLTLAAASAAQAQFFNWAPTIMLEYRDSNTVTYQGTTTTTRRSYYWNSPFCCAYATRIETRDTNGTVYITVNNDAFGASMSNHQFSYSAGDPVPVLFHSGYSGYWMASWQYGPTAREALILETGNRLDSEASYYETRDDGSTVQYSISWPIYLPSNGVGQGWSGEDQAEVTNFMVLY